MKKTLIWLGSFIFVVSVGPCWALTTREVVQSIQKRYESVWSLTAEFAQESASKMLNQTRIKKARGKVYFKKSGMMRWQYTTEPRNEWVSNGETLWFYQPEEDQVVVKELNAERGSLFLAFLLGEGDLHRDFKILGWDEEVEESEGGYRIEMRPREPHAMMDRLALTVDRETSFVRKTEVHDAYGNVTRTRFDAIRVNQKLPPDIFTFQIPPGTEVVESFPMSPE